MVSRLFDSKTIVCFFLRQIERLYQKDCHLGAGHIYIGTVDAHAAPARDAFRSELLDPFIRPVTYWHICENTSGGGRSECQAVFGFDEENRHLRTGQVASGQ